MIKYIPPPTPKNKTLRWHGIDLEQLYHLNQQRYPEKMLQWENSNVDYVFNSEGFRNSEFKKHGALFLGCSFTLGEGVTVDDRWSNIVSKELGIHENNLGISGSSGDACFRMANHWIPAILPSHVFILYPFMHRREEFKFDKLFRLFAHEKVDEESMNILFEEKEFDKMVDHEILNYHIHSWLTSDQNVLINRAKNIMSIKNICNENGSKLTEIYVDDINVSNLDTGRDLIHPGIEAHKYIANLFLEKMD